LLLGIEYTWEGTWRGLAFERIVSQFYSS